MQNLPQPGRIAILKGGPGPRRIWVEMTSDGVVTGYSGHVDLGTGITTSLAQIIAEELDLPLSQARMVLGDTAETPDQGPTIASETIQISAVPLRQAAAQLRGMLLQLAAARVSPEDAQALQISSAGIFTPGGRGVSFADLLGGQQLEAVLDEAVAVKSPEAYRLVGQSQVPVDLEARLRGDFRYIQDFSLEGMVHGHVIRPPYAGRDSGAFIGNSLLGYDEAAVSGMPGFIAVVREGDFLGVVAETSVAARRIAESLPVRWHLPPPLPEMGRLPETLREQPAAARVLDRSGDFEKGMAEVARPLTRSYLWPYHLHGSIGPSCAVADWQNGRPVIWAGTQNPHMLQGDLAQLSGLSPEAIEIRRLQAAGCYGRNCADDVCGDALLLSRATGRPVRVQLTREQEHLWEPKGAAQLMDVSGGLSAGGDFHAYSIDTWYPSNRGPNLALLLTGIISPEPRPCDMGDRTIIPPYRIPNKRVTVHDLAPLVRASWMRGVSALPNTFAHESFIDELAAEAGEDPVAFRLRHLDDPREADLVRQTAEAAGWEPHEGPRLRREGRMAYGQGFAFATYIHGPFPGKAAASAAWVCDVAVDTLTGEVTLTRVFVGQDQGLVIDPDGVRAQIHGNVIQTASRALREEVTFDAITPTPRNWATYPIQTFEEVPEIGTLLIERPGLPALGVGESAAVPAAAAIANAIFDATGVRLREAPFTPEKLRAALAAEAGTAVPKLLPGSLPARKPRRLRGWLAGGLTALGGALTFSALGLPVRPAIPTTVPPAAGSFSQALLDQGAQVFALGDCAVCHTAEGGVPNAGGRAMETPFGTVYTTNLTPDPETGLGQWSYEAFRRAMREGVSRDGRHLYPAFPYTAFAKISDADLFALYAYLQTLPAVSQPTPVAQMTGPAALRPAMAGWNLLFHDPAPLTADPAQSEAWNRGRYLVEGAGHCSGCHTPRGLLGNELSGPQAYSGAMVDGWWAPALGGEAAALRGWNEETFLSYLRTGHAAGIASASGPMAPVIHSLSALPEADLQAMSVYLASLSPGLAAQPPVEEAAPLPGRASQIFRSACASCHEPGLPGSLTAAQISLSRSAALRAPDRAALSEVIRHGVTPPEGFDLPMMPGFAATLSLEETEILSDYLRARYAPDLPPWP